jgi:formylglycine-generating enzyme required for sulfatase activity
MGDANIGSVACAALLVLSCASGASAQSCSADVNIDGVVDGVDLAAVLGAWGTDGQGFYDTDIDDNGVVSGSDLAYILGGWGTCPVIVPSWATLVEAYPDSSVVIKASLRSAIRATGYAWRVRDTATQIEMVLIPPGTFQMGCSPSDAYGCLPPETPSRLVTLTQPFYLGRYEVSQAQWTGLMGSNPAHFQSASAEVPAEQVPNRPVEQVSWNVIQEFLSITGLRLPTECQWEWAYRGGTTTAFHSMPGYPNGTNEDSLLDNIGWFQGNAGGQTHPVGLKASNGFGLHDMSGNVVEWMSDWWSETYYSSSPPVDPLGPVSGQLKALRGGTFLDSSRFARSSARMYASAPSDSGRVGGFRVARDP